LADFPVLSQNKLQHRDECVNSFESRLGWMSTAKLMPVYESATLKLFRLEKPDSLVFKTDDPANPLTFDADQAEVIIHTDGLAAGTNITANFIRLPWTTAEVNGKRLKDVELLSDPWQRIQFSLPEPAMEVHIRYSPPWDVFLLAGSGLIGFGIVFGVIAQAQMKKEKDSPLNAV
jgi:hypothetical protein